MPRRSPPSSLRLATGPTPLRRQVERRDAPKYTMPSLPGPAFQRPTDAGVVLARARPVAHTCDVVIGREKESEKRIRGPWDHSGSICLDIDVDRLLAPPVRAMIVVRG
ncbi:hypothetical protein CPC08DRAFT_640004 [Agrocybe pediades]|nr:hypothetical protein CPC08DRAFT_640004 [Agrocybe pediades]